MTDRDLDQLCVNTIRFLAADAVQQAKSGHPGLPMGAAPMAYVLWTALPAPPSGGSGVARSRPVRPVRRPRLDAPLRASPPHGLRPPARGDQAFPPVGLEDAGASGVRAHAGRRGDDGTARPRARQRRRHGHRRAPPRPAVQPARSYRRRPPHLRHLLRRRPHGGRRRGGRIARRPPRARQADLSSTTTTRSRSTGRRPCRSRRTCARRFEGYGWHVQAVPDGNDLDAIDKARSRRAGRDGAPVARRRADGDRLRRAEEGRDPRGPRRAARGCGAARRRSRRWAGRSSPPFLLPEAAVRRVPRGPYQRDAGRGRLASAARGLAPALSRTSRPQWDQAQARALTPGWDAGPPAVPGGHAGGDPGRERRRARGRVAPPAAARGRRRRPRAARPRRSSRPRDRSCAARPRGGTSTSACASTRWGRSPTASPITAGCASFCSDLLRLLRLHAAGGAARRAHRSCRSSTCGRTIRSVLGEDGPTHQPVEHLASLRAMPNLVVIRPADANETVVAWQRRARAAPRPDRAGAHAPEGARARPRDVRAGRRASSRRLRPRGRAGRSPRDRPDRHGLRGPAASWPRRPPSPRRGSAPAS